MKLQLATSETSLTVDLADARPTPDMLSRWRDWQGKMLTSVLDGESVCLIIIDPQPWSLFTRDEADARFDQDGVEYVLRFSRLCTSQLVRDVVDSEEWERGLLWLTTVVELAMLRELFVGAEPGLAAARRGCELLYCENDGYQLCWINPSPSKSRIDSAIRQAAASVGNIEITALDDG